jgi:hypothetical protein
MRRTTYRTRESKSACNTFSKSHKLTFTACKPHTPLSNGSARVCYHLSGGACFLSPQCGSGGSAGSTAPSYPVRVLPFGAAVAAVVCRHCSAGTAPAGVSTSTP